MAAMTSSNSPAASTELPGWHLGHRLHPPANRSPSADPTRHRSWGDDTGWPTGRRVVDLLSTSTTSRCVTGDAAQTVTRRRPKHEMGRSGTRVKVHSGPGSPVSHAVL